MANMKLKKELIALVEQYPCLYDKQSKSYHDKEQRDQKWAEIAEILEIEGMF